MPTTPQSVRTPIPAPPCRRGRGRHCGEPQTSSKRCGTIVTASTRCGGAPASAAVASSSGHLADEQTSTPQALACNFGTGTRGPCRAALRCRPRRRRGGGCRVLPPPRRAKDQVPPSRTSMPEAFSPPVPSPRHTDALVPVKGVAHASTRVRRARAGRQRPARAVPSPSSVALPVRGPASQADRFAVLRQPAPREGFPAVIIEEIRRIVPPYRTSRPSRRDG